MLNKTLRYIVQKNKNLFLSNLLDNSNIYHIVLFSFSKKKTFFSFIELDLCCTK